MTKKWFLFPLAMFLLALVFFSGALAEEYGLRSWPVPERGICVLLPDEYDVFTRDTTYYDDRDFSRHGLTREIVSSYMNSGDYYLLGLSPNDDRELSVSIASMNQSDFRTLSDSELHSIASDFVNFYRQNGDPLDHYEIYRAYSATYLLLWMPFDGSSCTFQCITVRDSQAVSLTLSSYSSRITASDEHMMLQVLDNILFL